MKSVLYKGGVSASEGLAVRFHSMEKGHCTIQHWHEYCELEFVVRGTGLHQVGGKEYRFGAGYCWLVGGIESHGILTEEETELANLSFFPDLLPEELGSVLDTRPVILCRFPDARRTELEELFRRIAAEETPHPFSRLNASALLVQILVAVLREAGVDTSVPPAFLRTVTAWARRHFREEAKLSALASELSVSPNHLGKVFRNATGIAFSDYITGLRLNRACHLLSKTDLPVKVVALDSGFRSVEYFHTVFRAHLGRTPAEYRAETENSEITLSPVHRRIQRP